MIAACIIVKNARETIEDCIKSLNKCVDFLNITDTGSDDGTIRLIHKTCKKLKFPYKFTEFKWIDDFAAARNFNFAQAPAEAEWLFWVDSDDTVDESEPNMLRKLTQGCPPEVGAIWLAYHYGFDEYGNCTTLFIRERILSTRWNWVWQSKVHETVAPDSDCAMVRDPNVTIIHHHHGGDDRSGRNFKLLWDMHKEDAEAKRVWLYLGHQFFASGQWEKAAEWYLKVASVDDVLQIEKFQALTYAARALRIMNKPAEAIKCDLTALELYPQWADPYVGMCLNYNLMKAPDKAIYWGEIATDGSKGMPDDVIFVNPLDYTFNVMIGLFEAYASSGRFDDAQRALEAAITVRPLEELKVNLGIVQEGKAREAIVYGIKALMNNLLGNKELFKLKAVKDIMPFWMEQIPDTEQMKMAIDHYTMNPEMPTFKTDIAYTGGERVLTVGTDLFTEKLFPEYAPLVFCADVLEHIDTPLSECLQVMEQFGDEVICRIGLGNRIITQQELERAAAQSHRRLIDLYQDDKGLYLRYVPDFPDESKLAVKVYCGPGFEQWNPLTIDTKGCGGSEISVAWLCEELGRRGHRPIVYAEGNGVYEKVVYRQGFNPQVPCDLFISSRVPELLTVPTGGAPKVLWVHDIHCGPRLTTDIVNQIDGIIVLSRWHLEFMQAVYPWLKDCKVVDFRKQKMLYHDIPEPHVVFEPDAKLEKPPTIFIMADAIKYERFKEWDEERHPHRFVWTSSPDRGLEQLFALWPLIKLVIPDAELHIFYGWEYYDTTLGLPGQAEQKERILKAAGEAGEGIRWRGRVNPLALAKELKQAGVWLYPPGHDFRETCCISAFEMQAAGVLCFYRMNGALGEAVGNRGIPLDANQKPEATVKVLKETLTNSNLCANIQRKARKWASTQTYERMADEILEVHRLLKGD